MPFDAFFLDAVVRELRPALIGARVEKLQQPARDLILLQLRGKRTLLLSASTARPRVHFTAASYENPAQPPMFCMLLRKHLTGGRIADISQPPAERLIDVSFDCTDEMGVPCRKHLILELMGRNSNLILTGADGRIVDCLRRVDYEMSEQRQVLPGLFYRLPPAQDKRSPQDIPQQVLSELLEAAPEASLSDWLLDRFSGISPLVARELSFGFTGQVDARIAPERHEALAAYLCGEFARFSESKPVMLLKDGGVPVDFCFRPILQYGLLRENREYPTFSALLDAFYTQTDRDERMKQRSQNLRKTVKNSRDRALRKLELQKKELASTLDREQLRRMGDIVTANLYAIERGQARLRAVDFYDEQMREIEIPLKPELSPQQNAARYYKEYTKAKHAEKVLTEQLRLGQIEAEYLGAVLDELSRAENERDLTEIRTELEAGGYLRPDRKNKQKVQPSGPMEFRSSDGYPIYVGRNNRQNDQLSLKTARRDDLWLHVQKFHGTHVIIACAGVTPPDTTITEAAMLAAWFSEARQGQNVPVDITPVRNLRKPNGAKPGMVVYERYNTVIVTPEASLADRLTGKEHT